MKSSRGRARVRVLVPFTNSNLEPDFALMYPEGISIHVARMGGYDADEIPDTEQMQGLRNADLEEPLRLMSGARPDVVIFGCTSASLTHGPAFDRDRAARIADTIGAAKVTAAGALVHALRALPVRRIGFASPYVPAINDMAIAFLADQGIETCTHADVDGILSNQGQGALTLEDVYALGLRADAPEAEALVLSCTDMRVVETLEVLEHSIGKPVISSNQAMLCQALEMLGLKDPVPGFGTLLRGLCVLFDPFRRQWP